MRKRKFVFIIGPSAGVGKTSLVNRLLKLIPQSIRVITMTTCSPRADEVEGEFDTTFKKVLQIIRAHI